MNLKPEKPADWKKPEKQYGGASPKMIEVGPGGVRPDLSTIGDAIVQRVKNRKERITTPGYCMKVRESCPMPCCQYLQQHEEEEKVIIKKVIRRRRPKKKDPAQESAGTPGQVGSPPPPNQQQQQQQAAAEAAARQEAARRQHEEAERKRQEEMHRQQQEAERQRLAALALAEQKRQAELQRQQQEEAERQRQAELQRQQQEEAERQRQAAAAAAAAAPPAAPTQKVATFQNLGTDPGMAKAELYYESTRWGPLGHGDPAVSVGSFPGHRWFIVANGCYAKLFTVGEEEKQTFTI